ncbi:MAG: hypothetical protein WC996_09760 [Peptostreptococcales bacterium]|jgi:hypothetical protein
MKNDLIITRFKTENTHGTRSYHEMRTFFGSKMMDIEDYINIDDSTIQYSDIFSSDDTDSNNNGYQHYDNINYLEKIYLIDLFNIKLNHHSINILPQSDIDMENNTNWSLTINWENILIDYLFYKIKQSRTFKCIKYNDVLSENINNYIKNYIKTNILNRYKIDKIDLYIKYISLFDGDVNINPVIQFNPIFDRNIKNEKNLIKNVNLSDNGKLLNINYKQIKKSSEYKFDYYFDINFIKI